MQLSSGRPHMLMSNQRGRGHDPVTVVGRIRSLVTVSIAAPSCGWTAPESRSGRAGCGSGSQLRNVEDLRDDGAQPFVRRVVRLQQWLDGGADYGPERPLGAGHLDQPDERVDDLGGTG